MHVCLCCICESMTWAWMALVYLRGIPGLCWHHLELLTECCLDWCEQNCILPTRFRGGTPRPPPLGCLFINQAADDVPSHTSDFLPAKKQLPKSSERSASRSF